MSPKNMLDFVYMALCITFSKPWSKSTIILISSLKFSHLRHHDYCHTKVHHFNVLLTLKRLRGWVNLTRLLFFEKCIFSETLVFCDFWYCRKSHLSWQFPWNSSSRSEDMKNYSIIISYFHWFSSIFWIFWHFLVTKKLMT